VGRRWYLVGWDLTRHDWRSFRVDRIDAAAATGGRFRPRALPADDAAEFVKRGLRSTSQRHRVSVRVRTDAAAVRRHVGRWGEVEELDVSRCRLTMEVDDLAWPLFVLAGLAAEFDVEGPPELVERTATVGALFTRAAQGPDG
jgi:predicted DNA-binding transcriptional regulator YafY